MGRLFVSCDWGTSNLRVRLVDAQSGQIVEQVTSHQGIARTYEEWQGVSQGDRVRFYLGYIEAELARLPTRKDLDYDAPIIISGMASSTIGLLELPFASTPISGDGRELGFELIQGSGLNRPVYLVSGIRYRDDVIRGEETQVLGLGQLQKYDLDNLVVVLPGTHSKHVVLIDGKIDRFRTFVTGELFEIITSHSILGKSIQRPGDHVTPDHEYAFSEGVAQSQIGGITGSFFKVRTNQLFERMTAEQNYYYLSGLLLGAELESLPSSGEVLLGGEQRLRRLYKMGVYALGIHERCQTLTEEETQFLTPLGHKVLLNRLSHR